jgi:benzoyl-CoA reductase subunit C
MKKVDDKKIGVLSNYIPEEIVEIFGIPYRIIGDLGGISEPIIPSFTCSFVKDFVSAFNSGRLDFLSGVIIPQSCDSLYAAFDLLERKNKFVYRFPQPIKNTQKSRQYFEEQINYLIKYLENNCSTAFSDNALMDIIKAKNAVKQTLRDIGYLISAGNKNIPYRTFLFLILKAMRNRSHDILPEMSKEYEELKQRDIRTRINKRVMIVGPIVDNFDILDAIESFSHARIVYDNITNGWRYLDGSISEELPPIEAISAFYLNKLNSPSFDNDERYLKKIEQGINEYGINRLIMINQRGCELHGFYIPRIQQYCDEKKIIFLPLTVDHTEENLDKIILRINSFMEMTQ